MRRTLTALLALLIFTPATAQAATRYIAPGGTGTACSQTAPCGNLHAAYVAAASGDTIQVAQGSYAEQGNFGAPAIDGTKQVTVQGNGTAKFRQLINTGSNYTIDGITLDAAGTHTSGAVLETGGGHDITIRNGSIGNVLNEKGVLAGGQTSPASLNVTFDNITFTGGQTTDAAVHSECIYSQAPGLTVKNSRIPGNCGTTGGILLTYGDWWGQQPYGGWTFTGNTFARQQYDHGSIIFGGVCTPSCDRAQIRSNTFDPASMPNTTNGASFTNSAESCNKPQVNLPGIVHETCGGPVPTPTPTPTVTPSPSPTATPTPSPTPTPTPSPTPSPTPTPTPTATASPTATPTPTPTPYEPACAPTCDQQIADLQGEVARLMDKITTALRALED